VKLPSSGRKIDDESRGAKDVAADHHIASFREMGQDREISLDSNDFRDRQFAVEHWDINGLSLSRSLVKYSVCFDSQPRGQPWVDARVIGPRIDQSVEVSYPIHDLGTADQRPGDDINGNTRAAPTEIVRGGGNGDPVPPSHPEHDGLSSGHAILSPMSDRQGDDDKRQRDKLLLRLLKAPPKPRPKRERGKEKAKVSRSRGKRVTAGKR
jgi:hypothetical protein